MSPWPAPERDVWRSRPGILSPTQWSRALADHPAWRCKDQGLVRELRYSDFDEAFGLVERIAAEVEDFGRRPDICLHDGNRVRITIANPHRAGITLAELRLLAKVDVTVERYEPSHPTPMAGHASLQPASPVRSHDHPLSG